MMVYLLKLISLFLVLQIFFSSCGRNKDSREDIFDQKLNKISIVYIKGGPSESLNSQIDEFNLINQNKDILANYLLGLSATQIRSMFAYISLDDKEKALVKMELGLQYYAQFCLKNEVEQPLSKKELIKDVYRIDALRKVKWLPELEYIFKYLEIK